MVPLTHNLYFQIIKQADPIFKLIEETFNSTIIELYGNRCSTLKKLKKINDRHCEMMFLKNKPLGFLIYKKTLQSEFGLTNAFELKTLFVFNPEKNARKGLGSLLFSRAMTLAQEKDAKWIYGTVVESNAPIISCAVKNGFIIAKRGEAITNEQRKSYPLEINELLLIKKMHSL